MLGDPFVDVPVHVDLNGSFTRELSARVLHTHGMESALQTFAPHRPRLLRVAHRMLGTMADAEDVVQEAYLRWHETDRDAVRTSEAFLVSTVARLAIDRQRRLQTERKNYPGIWLPEPFFAPEATRVERSAELDYAALVLLERLSADERAAFLLHEIFDVDYPPIAEALEKSEAACRKLVQRAKERLATAQETPRAVPTRDQQRDLLERLLLATQSQDPSELQRLLVDDIKLSSDGGGKVFAARYALEGAHRVATTLWKLLQKDRANRFERLVLVNEEPAIALWIDGKLYGLAFAHVDDAQIGALYLQLNPDKLARVAQELRAQQP